MVYIVVMIKLLLALTFNSNSISFCHLNFEHVRTNVHLLYTMYVHLRSTQCKYEY